MRSEASFFVVEREVHEVGQDADDVLDAVEVVWRSPPAVSVPRR
jgi:hypothetical protein